MDSFNWPLLELLYMQTARDRQLALQPLPPTRNGSRRQRGGVKRALASTFVRLGLRLDPAAGEGLGVLDLSLAQPEGRRQA